MLTELMLTEPMPTEPMPTEPVQILYATDGSDLALLGADFLSALPLDTRSEIRLLSVVSATQTRDDVLPALDAACAALHSSPARLTRCIRDGHAAEEILREAEAVPTDLVVVGVQGKSAVARFFLGSVSESVARHGSCSVLVARPLKGALDVVLVGIDGSQSAQDAVHFLSTFPLPTDCTIHLVTVVFPEAVVQAARHTLLPSLSDEIWSLSQKERADAAVCLAKAAAELAVSGHRVTTTIRAGTGAVQLLEAAEEIKADLLVVGVRGISDMARFLLGSVSERALRHALCSVLIVR